MNKGDLIGKVAVSAGITRAQAEDAVNAVVDCITTALKEGDDVALIGFGTFRVRHRPARIGHNPRTKERIQIAAKNVASFRPGKKLKDALS